MTGNVEEKVAIAAGVAKLVMGRATKGNATKDERAGVEGEFLLVFLSLFADELDRFQMLQLALADSNNGGD
ncbi:MAG TPA: hypothetical protein VMO17_20355 [Terriglobia bacterium]|nr:hypothetical protein [Terriglobia bacterium]